MISDNDVIQTFFAIEITNPGLKKELLATIQQLIESNVESKLLTFNIYSITIFPTKNEVIISNDVISEEADVTISLTDFLKAINSIKKY